MPPMLDQNLSQQLRRALTADKDDLCLVLQEQSAEILLAALRNPCLDEPLLLTLFKRHGLPQEVFTAVYAGKRLLESYKVKFALVSHPETPSHISQALLPNLYIFDLLKISYLPGSTQDQRLAAERSIIQRIPTQPFGNKLTLARRGTTAVAEALLRDGIPQVVEACLDNPHLKEGAVHQFVGSAKATAETLSMIARSGRWKGRPNIRLAILKNPRTPDIWFTIFLPLLPKGNIKELLSLQRLSSSQKELLRQALQRGGS